MAKPSVLITGCSAGGIGSALALEFLSKSFVVFAIARDLTKVQHLKDVGCEVIELDVCDDDAVVAVKTFIAKKLEGRGLDFLINNAGMTYFTPLLDAPMPVIRQLYNTNIFSIIHLTQTFFPLLRKAKGAVVNIGSVAPWLLSTYGGIYSSSKEALARLTHQVRMEFEPFGVDVVLISTGIVATSIQDTDARTHRALASPPSLYFPISSTINGILDPWKAYAISPELYAQKVTSKIVLAKGKRRPAVLVEGGKVGLFWFVSAVAWSLVGIFGVRVWDTMNRKVSGLGELREIVRAEEGALKED